MKRLLNLPIIGDFSSKKNRPDGRSRVVGGVMACFKIIFCFLWCSGVVVAAQDTFFEPLIKQKKIVDKKGLLVGLLKATRVDSGQKIPTKKLAAYTKIAQIMASLESYRTVIRETIISEKDHFELFAEDFSIQYCHPFIAHELLGANKVLSNFGSKRPLKDLLRNIVTAKATVKKIIPFVREMVFDFIEWHGNENGTLEKRNIGIISLDKLGFPGQSLRVVGLTDVPCQLQIKFDIIAHSEIQKKSVASADVSIGIGSKGNFIHLDRIETCPGFRKQGHASFFMELIKGLARGLCGENIIHLYPNPFNFGAQNAFDEDDLFNDVKKKLVVFYKIHGFAPVENGYYQYADFEYCINNKEGRFFSPAPLYCYFCSKLF